MRILGLIGSYRKLGNTEVLVKEALMKSQRLGAEVDVLRLTDLKIESCKGCMACAFKQEECRIADGWHTFWDKLTKSDAVILGAPTYLLGPAGIIKMIIDRNIAFHARTTEHPGKVGAIMGVFGVQGWEPFTLPMLNVFMLTSGVRIIDQVMFHAQGPGEILLDDPAMERARTVGLNVFEAFKKPPEERTYVGEQGACPVCHQNLFSVENGTLVCALCQAKAELKTMNEKIKFVFDPESLKNNRWSEEALLANFSLAILPSGPRFLKEREKIKQKASKHSDFLNGK